MHKFEMSELCVIFYIFDDLNRFLDSFALNSNTTDGQEKSKYCEINCFKHKKKFISILKVDGYFLSVFSRLIKVSEVYSGMVFNNLLNTLKFTPVDYNVNIKFQLVEPKLEILDYAWNDRMFYLIVEQQELEHAMSWLSTLGGAFSALGDSFENCAKVAGKISIQQFKIAFQRGEPPLVARCRLYMALSLIQLGKLTTAKKMIEKQYQLKNAVNMLVKIAFKRNTKKN